jgi:uncharacterized membrane protein YGL010W
MGISIPSKAWVVAGIGVHEERHPDSVVNMLDSWTAGPKFHLVPLPTNDFQSVRGSSAVWLDLD